MVNDSALPAWHQGGSVAQGVAIADDVAHGNYQELELEELNFLQ